MKTLTKKKKYFVLLQLVILGGGQNVEFQNNDWPFFSERQNCLFSSSLVRQKKTFDVLILPMASKKITTSKIKISTTYGVLPMVTKACGGLG